MSPARDNDRLAWSTPTLIESPAEEAEAIRRKLAKAERHADRSRRWRRRQRKHLRCCCFEYSGRDVDLLERLQLLPDVVAHTRKDVSAAFRKLLDALPPNLPIRAKGK
jgi:hypothetical protein